jgi:hypothetical protein
VIDGAFNIRDPVDVHRQPILLPKRPPRQPQNLKSTAAPAIPQSVSRESAADRREELALLWHTIAPSGFAKPRMDRRGIRRGRRFQRRRHSGTRSAGRARVSDQASDELRELTVTVAVARFGDECAVESYCRDLTNRKELVHE